MTGSGPVIARGSGLSYCAASFGGGAASVDMTGFDRVLDVDSAGGAVHVQAGITLGALHAYLAPRGLYLPVQPGYSQITVGGCIAADVHGKNPSRDGTFGAQVERLTLFHPDHGTIALSRTEHPEIFDLTRGGYGLTGVILSAVLKAQRLPGARVISTDYPAADAPAAAALLRQHAAESDFTYAWLDFAHLDHRFGRGYVTALRFDGDAAAATEADHAFPPGRLTPERRGRFVVPVLYRPSIQAMNFLYTALRRRKGPGTAAALGTALFTFNGNEIYHAFYGRPGFHETQVIVPHAALPEYVACLRQHSTRFRAPIALGAGKLFAGAPAGLRFDGDGVCIAINLRRGRAAADFLTALDRDVVRLGGRPNIVKDSRLPRAVFEAAYPAADAVRSGLRAWDPKRRFRSEVSERLGL